jgi:hypothetical protein
MGFEGGFLEGSISNPVRKTGSFTGRETGLFRAVWIEDTLSGYRESMDKENTTLSPRARGG